MRRLKLVLPILSLAAVASAGTPDETPPSSAVIGAPPAPPEACGVPLPNNGSVAQLQRWCGELWSTGEEAAQALAREVMGILAETSGVAEQPQGITGTLRSGSGSACEGGASGVLLPAPMQVASPKVGPALIQAPARRAWLTRDEPCLSADPACAPRSVDLPDGAARRDDQLAVALPELPEGRWALHVRRSARVESCVPFEVRALDADEREELGSLPPEAAVLWLHARGRLWELRSLALTLGPEDVEARGLVVLVACSRGLSADVLGVAAEGCAPWR